jgi:hypothetical protein
MIHDDCDCFSNSPKQRIYHESSQYIYAGMSNNEATDHASVAIWTVVGSGRILKRLSPVTMLCR